MTQSSMQQSLGHLMVDIETMGHRSNSVICSIGAVEFSLETGATGQRFYERVSIQSCLDAGLTVNGSTIEWWLTESEEARSEIAKGGKRLYATLHSFTRFVESLKTENLQVWGNGARFDLGILADAYYKEHVDNDIPWKFRNERDVRTLVSLNPSIRESCEKIGTTHHALDDCLSQIKYCHQIFYSITLD